MKDSQCIPTIGLEIHAELKTESKMFCSCKNDPDEERSNTNICPVCLGHPGTLPVLNMTAVKHVLRIGTALGGTLADFTEWDRKHYFYPDIPKGYQISQYAYPLVKGGSLAGINLERIHLEEDTARSTHDTHEKSLVDFNRSGVPLMELVTAPDMHSAEEAVNFAKELQLLIRTLGIGHANMEKGELRIEANVSVSPLRTSLSLGVKTEIKNLNSFRTVGSAIKYEIKRQIAVIEAGDSVVQETRGWDEGRQETYSQRSKESSPDYRYFPDPDIPKVRISLIPDFSLHALQKDMPELPWVKRQRYKKDFAMTDKEIAMFIEDTSLAEYFEEIISNFKNDSRKIKLTVNYLLTDYLGLTQTFLVLPTKFAQFINMIADGEISSRGAKDTLVLMIDDPTQDPKTIAQKHGLLQQSSVQDIAPIIDRIISENSAIVTQYKTGKTASLQYLIGQAMKLSGGAADPNVVKKLLIEKLT